MTLIDFYKQGVAGDDIVIIMLDRNSSMNMREGFSF